MVSNLARDAQAGGIALGGFLPANVPGEGPIARFSNVVVRPDVSFDLAAAAAKMTAAEKPPAANGMNIIKSWSVSRAFVPKDSPPPTLPTDDVTGPFTRLETGADGLVNLHQYLKLPQPDVRVIAAIARAGVRASRAGPCALDLGFSDTATVFVNGVPVFHGDDSYSFDRPRRDGLIGFDQARIYLPLKAGDNQLAIVVSDSFGGWGVMGRIGQC